MSNYMGYGVGMGDGFVPQGMIMTDTPCRKCGYNLRGLQHNGRCPECGTPAGVSICGDLLRFAHPRWLRQVAEGLNLILWGVLVTIIVSVLASIAFRREPAIAQFLAMMGSVVGAWGTWQMTTPDPSGIGETQGVNARRLVRAAVVAGLAASLAQWLATAGGLSLGGHLGVVAFTVVCGLMGIVGEFAKLQYIGHLANRLPDEALSSRANGLKWGLAICYGAIVVFGAVAAVGVATMVGTGGRPGAGAGLGFAALGCLIIPAGIARVIIAIMAFILVYRMGKAVQAQVPLALAIWSRAAAAAGSGGQAPPPAPAPENQRPRF